MAKYLGPQCRLCRTEKTKLFLKGERCHSGKCPLVGDKKIRKGTPGKDAKAKTKKLSDYGLQMREKQKLKRTYGMLEKQFKLTFVKASKKAGKTGDNLIILLESRLDNIVYRMRFGTSRKMARQLVSHGHFLVNGKNVNIPSYIVKPGDTISVVEGSKKMNIFKDSLKDLGKNGVYPWLEVDADNLTGKYVMAPTRAEITDLADIKENLIVELYSK